MLPNLDMFKRYSSFFCCPFDHGDLELRFNKNEIICTHCKTKFPIISGIPCFELNPRISQVKKQMKFMDKRFKVHPFRNINFRNRVLAEMNTRYFKKFIQLLGDLSGKTGLDLCAGNGNVAEVLLRENKISFVIISDISYEGLNAAYQRLKKKYKSRFVVVQCNAEYLPIRSDTVDVCFAVDALHHLPHKWHGLKELARTAKYALVLQEPLDNVITRMLLQVGIAQKRENSGNYVWRYDRNQVIKCLEPTSSIQVRTYFCHPLRIFSTSFFDNHTLLGISIFRVITALLDHFFPIILGICAFVKPSITKD